MSKIDAFLNKSPLLKKAWEKSKITINIFFTKSPLLEKTWKKAKQNWRLLLLIKGVQTGVLTLILFLCAKDKETSEPEQKSFEPTATQTWQFGNDEAMSITSDNMPNIPVYPGKNRDRTR